MHNKLALFISLALLTMNSVNAQQNQFAKAKAYPTLAVDVAWKATLAGQAEECVIRRLETPIRRGVGRERIEGHPYVVAARKLGGFFGETVQRDMAQFQRLEFKRDEYEVTFGDGQVITGDVQGGGAVTDLFVFCQKDGDALNSPTCFSPEILEGVCESVKGHQTPVSFALGRTALKRNSFLLSAVPITDAELQNWADSVRRFKLIQRFNVADSQGESALNKFIEEVSATGYDPDGLAQKAKERKFQLSQAQAQAKKDRAQNRQELIAALSRYPKGSEANCRYSGYYYQPEYFKWVCDFSSNGGQTTLKGLSDNQKEILDRKILEEAGWRLVYHYDAKRDPKTKASADEIANSGHAYADYSLETFVGMVNTGLYDKYRFVR